MVNRQSKSWMIFALVGFASVSLFSKDIGIEDTRGIRSEPLRISSKKNSPAYSAFILSDYNFESVRASNVPTPVSKVVKLQAGQVFKFEDEEAKLSLELAQESQSQKLKGMVISSRQPITPVIQAEVEPAQDWVKELKTVLPQEQSRRIAQIEDWLRDQSFASPSASDSWKQKIKTAAPTDAQEKYIAASGGGQIYVGLPEAQETPSIRATQSTSALPAQVRPVVEAGEANSRPITLAGFIEMKEGLAYLGPQTSLVVTRKLGERQIESGTVWVSEGKFEIFVKEAKGYLVAELKDGSGQILGRGSLDLYKLPPAPDHQIRMDNIQLSLQPVAKGSQIASLSAHSYGGYKIAASDVDVVSAAHELKLKKAEHLHHTEDFVPGSTTILETFSEKALKTIDISQLSAEEELYVFEESYLKALVEFMSPSEVVLLKKRGFIIGRVTDNGKPVAHSEVEIAGDYAVEPIYFNEAFFPDRSLKTTSSNGMFAAVLLEPSLYSVRAKTNGVYLPAKVLPATAGEVTQALIDRKEIRSLAVNLFPFPEATSAAKAVTVGILGTEDEKQLPLGSHILQYHEGQGVFVIEAESGDFEPLVRAELPHGTDALDIPVFSRHWLDGLATKKRVNLDPEAGRAIGFGPNESFEVVVDKGQGSESIVYLDPAGKPVYEGLGPAGGSFVIYNLKPGLHTVSILTRNGSKIFSRVIVAEYEVVNLVNHKQ